VTDHFSLGEVGELRGSLRDPGDEVAGRGDLAPGPREAGSGGSSRRPPRRPEAMRLRRGALSGVELNLLLVPRSIPHVSALTDELVVTVSGHLLQTEPLRISEPLRGRQ
jgi:hypothetical protein